MLGTCCFFSSLEPIESLAALSLGCPELIKVPIFANLVMYSSNYTVCHIDSGLRDDAISERNSDRGSGVHGPNTWGIF